jgi:hypothetical protein
VHLEDAADRDAIGEHVMVVIVSLAGWARSRGAFEDQGQIAGHPTLQAQSL